MVVFNMGNSDNYLDTACFIKTNQKKHICLYQVLKK